MKSTKNHEAFKAAVRMMYEKPSIRKAKRMVNTIRKICNRNRKNGDFANYPVTKQCEWNKVIIQYRKQFNV